MAQTAAALIGYGLNLATAERIEQQGMRMPDIKALTDDELRALEIPPHVIEAIRDSSRTPIPPNIVTKMLKDAAFACCICKDRRKSVVLHHIRKYNESRDHSEDNLVVICLDHHDAAHTYHELSQNLSPERLMACRAAWLEEVRARQKETLVAVQHPTLPSLLRPKEYYLPFVNDDDLCPACGKGHLRWFQWGPSPFGIFSAWFKCLDCGDIVASQEQFGM